MRVKQDSAPEINASRDLANLICVDEHPEDEQTGFCRAAQLAAHLVIERWQDGSRRRCADLNLPHHQSARARWYDMAQQGLQDWIARGGFSQPVDEYDATALAGHGATLPVLYRLSTGKPRWRG